MIYLWYLLNSTWFTQDLKKCGETIFEVALWMDSYFKSKKLAGFIE